MMAVIFADSFDHYGGTGTGLSNMVLGVYAEVPANLSSQGPSTTFARTGSRSLFLNLSSAILRKALGVLRATVGTAWSVYLPGLPSSNSARPWLQFRRQDNSTIITVYINTDGTLSCYFNDAVSGSLIGTSTASLTASGWHHLEAKCVVSETLGSIEVKLNGETIYVATDLDTGTDEVAQVAWGTGYSNNGSPYYLDDVVIWDSEGDNNMDFLGPVRVYTFYPENDVSPVDWTANGASTIAQCIDETAPDGDTTYTQGSNEGDVFQVTLPELPDDIGLINAVQINNMSKISEAGIAQIEVGMISNGQEETGTGHILTTAYTYRSDVFQVNPDGNIPWLRAALEAAVVKVEKTV